MWQGMSILQRAVIGTAGCGILWRVRPIPLLTDRWKVKVIAHGGRLIDCVKALILLFSRDDDVVRTRGLSFVTRVAHSQRRSEEIDTQPTETQ